MKFFGGGTNWIILAFSLLLAFFMWSIMKLSGTYSSYVRYSVMVTTNIEGRTNTAVATDLMVVNAKSTGFHIMQNSGGNAGVPLVMEHVDARYFEKCAGDNDLFYILTADIRQGVQDKLGEEVRLEAIMTDTLFFSFPVQSNRRVPVEAITSISFAPQHMAFSKLSLKPDSITVYGEEQVISQIERVLAQGIKGDNVNAPVTGVAQISPIEGVRFSDEEVVYSLDAGRYVEFTLKVPVSIDNAPSYANVAIIPQEVTVKYRQPFKDATACSPQDFRFSVNYQDVLMQDVNRLNMTRLPNNLLTVDIEPKFVECVL